MSVALSQTYIDKLREGSNSPNIIYEVYYTSFEVHLADGSYLADGSIIASSGDAAGINVIKYGLHRGGFNDVIPIANNPSALQNKLDVKKGYATKGSITFTLNGRLNFKTTIKDEFLKNRKVIRYDGFDGIPFEDYVQSFSGTIQDWSRKGDTLTLTVFDNTYKTKLKLPVENETKTQFIVYMGVNPVDMMLDILTSADKLNINDDIVDIDTFLEEKDTWLNGWKVGIVLRAPTEASNILNDLQIQTNSFIIDDGKQISFKVTAPPTPNDTIPLYRDSDEILEGSASSSSGYRDFYNRIIILYDFDESSSNKEENYETAVVSIDADSLSLSEWNEVKTKTIKSNLFRTYGWSQPILVTGVVIYHVGKRNGLNAGKSGSLLEYLNTLNSVRWTAPDGTSGPWVELDQNGVYQLFDSNINKSIRISVDIALLPSIDRSDIINITGLSGDIYAKAVANKILQRYSNPSTVANFDVDLNKIDHSENLIKVSDTIDIESNEFFSKGQDSWTRERMMVTKIKPNLSSGKISLTAVQTRSGLNSGLKYGFIAPAGHPDYAASTPAQLQYCYVGDINNKVNAGTEDGYYTI